MIFTIKYKTGSHWGIGEYYWDDKRNRKDGLADTIIIHSASTVTADADMTRAQALAHEIGHALTHREIKCQDFDTLVMRREIIAWRFAKAICPPSEWNEDIAIDCLTTYAKTHLAAHAFSGDFPIIPIQILED